jgi:HEAT repeat protein
MIFSGLHHKGAQRLDSQAAEKLLAGGNTAEREQAAIRLGKLKQAASYEALVTALQRDDNPRGVQLAILAALKKIGDEFGHLQGFSCGLKPLEKFATRNISDAQLVKLACEALESAGTYDEIDAVSKRISAAAGDKYPAAASAASSLFLCFMH